VPPNATIFTVQERVINGRLTPVAAQPGQRDADESSDGCLGVQVAGCGEGV
jgi:hypothetical protein